MRLPHSFQAYGLNAFREAQEGCLHILRKCGDPGIDDGARSFDGPHR